MSTNLRAGDLYAVTPRALAAELKGKEWGVIGPDDVMYDAEFIGATTPSGSLLVKIKRKSTKQPKK